MAERPPDRADVPGRLNPLAAIGALIGAALVVGILIFALSQQDDGASGPSDSPDPSVSRAGISPSQSASVAPSASESASAEPEPSVAAGPPTIAWEEPEPFDGRPDDVIADGDTWVAVGWATERGPAAWTSSDSRTWMRADVPDPQPDPLFTGSGLGSTIRLGDSLLSYGTFIGCCDGRGVFGWRSADGTSWEVIESDSPLFEEGYLVGELALGGPALVATEIRYGYWAGRIWRWTAETSWVETTPTPENGDGVTGMEVDDVVWAEDRFVVVGARGEFDGPVTGTSWTSTEGETWQVSSPMPALEDVRLRAVAAAPGGGYVAVGHTAAAEFGNGGVPVAFFSTDGLAWTQVDAPNLAVGGRRIDLIPVDGGLVALGGSVWTSADGRSWAEAGTLSGEYMAGALMGDQLVVFTADYSAAGEGEFLIFRGTLGP